MAKEWFTDSELGECLNISPEAVRQEAVRHRWPRRTAKNGKTQLRVDRQDVVATRPPRGSKESSDARPTTHRPPVEPVSGTGSPIATLKDLFARAEALAGPYRDGADGERKRSDAERARADGLAAQIHDLIAARTFTAQKSVELTLRIEERRAIVRRMVDGRRWWRRLVG